MKIRHKVNVGIALPLILMVAIGAIAVFAINKLVVAEKLVDHTRVVLAEAADVVAAAADMETGMRGYLLAGEEEFLTPYKTGETAVYERILALQHDASDEPHQVARLDEVRSVLKAWQADVTEPQISLRREIGDAETMNDVADLVGAAKGKTYFDKFRSQIARFIEREQKLLSERQAVLEADITTGTASFAELRNANKWVAHTYDVIGEANAILAAAVDMETGMRGFLLAGKNQFLEPYTAGKDRFFAKTEQLRQTVNDNPAQVALLKEIDQTVSGWISDVVDPMISLRVQIGDSKTMEDMADLVGEAKGKQYFDKFRALMADFAAEEAVLMTERQAANASTVIWAYLGILGFTVAALLLGVIAAIKIGGSISDPVVSVTQAMRQLADGTTDIDVAGEERRDEIGEIVKATLVFKANALQLENMARQKEAEDQIKAVRQQAMADLQGQISSVVNGASNGDFTNRIETKFSDEDLHDLSSGINDLMHTVDSGVSDANAALSDMADGDLTHRMTGSHKGVFAELAANINKTAKNLSDLIHNISETSDAVGVATAEILQGANDLAQRTEDQAATVEKTSVAMEELATTVKENAQSANQANTLTSQASVSADEGSTVMNTAVAAMQGIESSASKIGEIVVMIDEIAFQTNLLALNAAVEAARAGEAGKGFAVVATEVRTLAQRSSEASKEIKTLIQSSSVQVDEGVNLVNKTGGSLSQIVDQVKEVSGLVAGIAQASTEQATGLAHLAAGVSQQDEASQQNAAMVEETTAAVQSLDAQIRELNQLVSVFKIDVSDLQEASARAA